MKKQTTLIIQASASVEHTHGILVMVADSTIKRGHF